MKKCFACWGKLKNSRWYHWLKADEAYLAQFQNHPQLFRLMAWNGAERWTALRCLMFALLALTGAWLLQLYWLCCGELFFFLQPFLLAGVFVWALGIVYLSRGRNLFLFAGGVFGLLTEVLLTIFLFEQLYILALFECVLLGHLLLGGALGFAFGYISVWALLYNMRRSLYLRGILP